MTTWTEDQDDLLFEAVEARERAKLIVEHLECAGCCEELKDFRVNILNAREDIMSLLKDVEELLIQAEQMKQ